MRVLAAPLLVLLAACVAAPEAPSALQPVADDLTPYIERQLREQGIRGASIAVLDVDPATGAERIWRRGFGAFDETGRPMPDDAVFRVASISKLFTDTAAMALVERGQLDLDAPIADLVPEFVEHPRHEERVTLRHLMGHRGGLVREPLVGHYFDPTEPSLEATVASLSQSELVSVPGTTFKYSNPGIGLVGLAVARAHGKPFADAVRELVLQPLALDDSDFAAREDLVARVPHGDMWTYDGRAIPTPTFAFGFGPAADLRATTTDLVAFARSWFPSATQRVLQPATQEAMWALPAGQKRGCGLGFFVRELDGHRRVGHDGAVYGFASCLQALPDDGIAVAVVCTKDFANEVSEAIALRALRAALAARRGERLPAPSHPVPVGKEEALRLAGLWRAGENHVWLLERDGELIYDPNLGVRTRLRRAADGALVADDALGVETARRLTILPNGNPHDGEFEYVRMPVPEAKVPDEMAPLLGEYGWDHDVLVVYEDCGKLAVLIEWVVRDVLEREGPDRYRFPPGMYGGDALVFERDASGTVVAAVVGGARFPRRSPPIHSEEPEIATENRDVALPGLQFQGHLDREPEVAAALVRADAELRTHGVELMLLTPLDPAGFFDVIYVTPPNVPSANFASSLGDETDRARPDWPGASTRARWFREQLRIAMRKAGFRADDRHWWRYWREDGRGR